MGLLALGLAERFIPVIPSYGLLAAIGAASADGVWPLWVAIGATASGGILGLAISYEGLRRLGQDRARRIFSSIARPMGLSDERAEALAARAQASTVSLALSLQLIPTVRFLAPILAIVAGMTQRGFLMASAFGDCTLERSPHRPRIRRLFGVWHDERNRPRFRNACLLAGRTVRGPRCDATHDSLPPASIR